MYERKSAEVTIKPEISGTEEFFRHLEAASDYMEKARAEIELAIGCELTVGFEVLDGQGSLIADQKGDEAADEGSGEPLCAGCGDLEREVVSAREDDEPVGDGDDVLRSGAVDDHTRLDLLDQGVEHDFVFIVGERNKVKVAHLPHHRFLVRGAGRVLSLEPPFEVSALSGVPADPEKVDG